MSAFRELVPLVASDVGGHVDVREHHLRLLAIGDAGGGVRRDRVRQDVELVLGHSGLARELHVRIGAVDLEPLGTARRICPRGRAGVAQNSSSSSGSLTALAGPPARDRRRSSWCSGGARSAGRGIVDRNGLAPLRWLPDARTELAEDLLETTDLPVEQVARKSGLPTAVTFRHHSTRTAVIPPHHYRRCLTGRSPAVGRLARIVVTDPTRTHHEQRRDPELAGR
ncbi:helix-turn-helix domain-containing protein [Saccharopolyspora aridisoli]|uniref:helix-turn-helix domain-containing protein n=1 Tax=Saccharopolyspora aridisoli TaxID=2530385 RepID=UPI0014045BE6|nr:helix-turn-helix domain-containing protein [Saccharopolyspora aridisoli]